MSKGPGAPYDNETGAVRTRILVVDDESHITDLVTMALRYEGFDAVGVDCGRAAIDAVARTPADLVILDVLLPDMDGFEVLGRLRESARRTPVIFLTARDTKADLVRGLRAGGDDYISKPFSLEELLARIQAVLRRSGDTVTRGSRIEYADVVLDEDTMEVQRAGQAIPLSLTEYKLLRYFMYNPRRVLSRGQILDQVWEYGFDGETRVVETYVSYLRRKLETRGPPLIRTVRGVGYCLRE